jgi:hypothetical protein
MEKIVIYLGLGISLWGVALIAVAWWFDFGLAVKIAGVLVGSALVYLGWRLTERGHQEVNSDG